MKFSLSQAAKETGKSKPTISKAIKTGRLSAEKIGQGYQIEASELFRVYPKKYEVNQQKNANGKPNGEPYEIKSLEKEVEMLREMLDREKEAINDLKIDRDKWRQQATALLEHKAETKGGWSRIFGKS